MARRRSESMLILHTAMDEALRSMSSGTPMAPGICPPNSLTIATYSCMTEEAPCSTMGKPGRRRPDLFEDVKTKLRLGAGLEFVGAVACADGDGKRVNPRARHKFLHLRRVGVRGVCRRNIDVVLHAGQAAQLAFDHNALVVSVVHNLLCQSDVLLKRVFGAVNHHGGKASVNTGFANLKAVAMVKVQADGKARVLKGRLYELHQIDVLGIFSGALPTPAG